MTRRWRARDFLARLEERAPLLRVGRIYSGTGGGAQGLDLECVRPGCDLTGCGRAVALAPWRLAARLRDATRALLAARAARGVHCVHIRSGKGETSDYLQFVSFAPSEFRTLENLVNPAPVVLPANVRR